VSDSVYPSIGWRRWLELVRKRIKRIPDSPHRIAMGLAVGVGVTFTPMFGFHFLTAAILALILRGNILAAILATFVGNPLTFPIIAVICFRLGNFILGIDIEGPAWPIVADGFRIGWSDLKANFWSLFGYEFEGWRGFHYFMVSVFIPYVVGGLIPGGLLSAGIYFGSKPLIERYQNRRKGQMAEKLQEWRQALIDARERAQKEAEARDREERDERE